MDGGGESDADGSGEDGADGGGDGEVDSGGVLGGGGDGELADAALPAEGRLLEHPEGQVLRAHDGLLCLLRALPVPPVRARHHPGAVSNC